MTLSLTLLLFWSLPQHGLPPTMTMNLRIPKNSHYSSELYYYYYFCMPPSRLVKFFSQSDILFKKKSTTRYTKKKELNRTLCFLICFYLFLYIYVFFIVCILLFRAVRLVALSFISLLLQLMLCIVYQVHHT